MEEGVVVGLTGDGVVVVVVVQSDLRGLANGLRIAMIRSDRNE